MPSNKVKVLGVTLKKIQQTLLLVSIAAMTGLVGCQTISAKTNHSRDSISTEANDNKQEIRNINQVTWHKSEKVVGNFIENDISEQQSRLVFIRLSDQGDRFSSANIGIDNRFQVSLQSNRFSEVVTCAGEHALSVQSTGKQSNDLESAPQTYKFDPQKTYFFLVTPENGVAANLRPIQSEQANELLIGTQRQTHQISRVISDCEPKVSQPIIPTVVSMPNVTVSQVEKDTKVELEKPVNVEILFNFDSAEVKPNYYPHLESIAKFMQQHPTVKTMIEGHTDSRGPATYNERLSTKRAEAVKSMLVTDFGIAPQRLSSVGYGESQPVASNATVQGRQQNRRVIAIVMNADSAQ